MSDPFSGFAISSIQMRDYETKQVLWKHDTWDFSSMIEAHIPKSILKCKAVAREIVFSSTHEIQALSLVQEVKLNGQTIEEWTFEFGFVIPNSQNAWEQVIYASDPDEMIPAEILSGNIVIETTFLQGSEAIHKSSVRIYYD
jgi:retinal rod rhodopsin-sensitive cGMP 3',5'-cyclic phosphodiesterase subunit delta